MDDAGANFIPLNFEKADGDGQFEAARAAGAGVEVEHAFFRDEIGHVRVAVEDGGEFGCGRIEVEGLEVVEHVDVAAFEFR